LEITAPGAASSGSYVLKNLIGDYTNKVLLDRGSDTSAYSVTSTDTSESSHPMADGAAATDSFHTQVNGYPAKGDYHKITGSMFSPLKDYTVEDADASKTYTETQNVWMAGYNEYVESDAQVDAGLKTVLYTLQFKGPNDDLGIPLCTTPTSGNYGNCSSDYQTETHKVKVMFLGSEWIISDMDASGTINRSSETLVDNGGSIKLAKESMSGILNQGESFDLGDVLLVLDDLEAHGETTSAIVSIVDKNGNVLKKDKVSPSSTKEISAGGKTYNIHLYKVAPGYTFGAKWADLAVYAQELKLEDGKKLDSDKDSNNKWTVVLGWKTKGAGTAGLTTSNALRLIGLYSTGGDLVDLAGVLAEGRFTKGKYVPLAQSPVAWKLTYAGLEAVEHDSLSFTMERTSDYTDLRLYNTANTLVTNCTMKAPYLTVSSGSERGVFGVSSTHASLSGRTGSDKKFYVALNGVGSCDGFGVITGNAGALLMKESYSSQNNYYVVYNYTGATNVTYSVIGDQTTADGAWNTGGLISYAKYLHSNQSPVSNIFGTGAPLSVATTEYVFAISEKAGEGQSLNTADKFVFTANATAGSASFNRDDTAAGVKKDYIRYIAYGPRNSNSTYKANFVSERGSIFSAIGDDYVNFNMAKSLAHAQFMLASSDVTETNPDVTTKIMGEGDEVTVNGVKIKVKSIDEKVGACSVGTGSAPSCTVDSTGVSAVIMGDGVDAAGVESFAAMAPYGAVGSLVVLDKDAVDTDTVVAVGGPMVNTVTKSVLEGSSVDFTATPKVVKEIVAGKKIVVAGYTAADTLEAAKDFVAAVKRV
jgi:hypothetical protein